MALRIVTQAKTRMRAAVERALVPAPTPLYRLWAPVWNRNERSLHRRERWVKRLKKHNAAQKLRQRAVRDLKRAAKRILKDLHHYDRGRTPSQAAYRGHVSSYSSTSTS